MRKTWVFIAAVLFIAGCGDSKPDNTSMAKTSMAKTSSKPSSGQLDNNQEERDTLISQGVAYLNQGDVLSAIKSFDSAIRRDPRDPTGYLILGETYLRLNNYDKAIDTFSAVLTFDPNNGQINYLMAVATNLRGQKDMAIKHAQKSVEIFQHNKDEENFLKSLALLQALLNSPDEKSQ